MKLSNFLLSPYGIFLKGLIAAIGGGIVAYVAPAIQNHTFVFDWTTTWHTAVASALTYLSIKLGAPTPKIVQIDPSKTSVIDKKTKQTILHSNN